MKYLLTTVLIALPALASAVTRFDDAQAALLQDGFVTTAEEFILPGYQALALSADQMTGAVGAYCAGDGAIEAVHDGFADTFLAWQRISVIGIGPVTNNEGAMRVQMWPDPKGFARRAIRSALAAQDPALLEPDGLKGRSVALVNLTALEALLYDDLVPGTYACDLALALSVFQSDLAAGFVADWSSSAFRTAFDTAATGNDTYPDIDSLIREFLAGAVVYTDRLRKFKIARGLGDAPGKARAERTEARRSGLGLKSIEVSFLALRDLYEVPYGFFDITPDLGGSMEFFMLGEGAGNISASLMFEEQSMAEVAEADAAMADQLRKYAELLLFHEDYLKVGLLASLGMTAGFTAADGD